MNVRLKNVCNRNVFLARKIEININVGARIENRAYSLLIIADEIRDLGQAFRFDRLKYERHDFARTISRSDDRTSSKEFSSLKLKTVGAIIHEENCYDKIPHSCPRLLRYSGASTSLRKQSS